MQTNQQTKKQEGRDPATAGAGRMFTEPHWRCGNRRCTARAKVGPEETVVKDWILAVGVGAVDGDGGFDITREVGRWCSPTCLAAWAAIPRKDMPTASTVPKRLAGGKTVA